MEPTEVTRTGRRHAALWSKSSRLSQVCSGAPPGGTRCDGTNGSVSIVLYVLALEGDSETAGTFRLFKMTGLNIRLRNTKGKMGVDVYQDRAGALEIVKMHYLQLEWKGTNHNRRSCLNVGLNSNPASYRYLLPLSCKCKSGIILFIAWHIRRIVAAVAMIQPTNRYY